MIDSDLLKITYAKSCVGYSKKQKDTVRSLGLRRLGESVILPDTPPVRGMIDKISHLVDVESVGEVEVQLASEAGQSKSGGKSRRKTTGAKTSSETQSDGEEG